MKKKNRGSRRSGGSRPADRGEASDEPAKGEAISRDYGAAIGSCQRILRLMTVAIMASFLLIIILTTASTSGFVQVTAKGLYHVILFSAVVSLVTWAVRVRLEKRTGQRGVNVPAEILKRM